jgi:hypothetical protein
MLVNFFLILKNKGTVIPTSSYCLGIRTRTETCRRSEKARKAKIILAVPEA